jgi:hypothetical protein
VLFEPKFESLFVDLGTPIGSFVLFNEFEATFLVEMLCSIKTLKSPEIYPLMAFVSTKVDSGVNEPIANASSA